MIRKLSYLFLKIFMSVDASTSEFHSSWIIALDRICIFYWNKPSDLTSPIFRREKNKTTAAARRNAMVCSVSQTEFALNNLRIVKGGRTAWRNACAYFVWHVYNNAQRQIKRMHVPNCNTWDMLLIAIANARNLLFALAVSAELRSSIDFQENVAPIWKARHWMLRFIQSFVEWLNYFPPSAIRIRFCYTLHFTVSATAAALLLLWLMIVEFRHIPYSTKSAIIHFVFVLSYYFESLFNVKCVYATRWLHSVSDLVWMKIVEP